ncbi:MAG TPA: hypothetical protein VGQ83_43245 [Polyangia bacterium]|jgi:hypothetical protein
MRTAGVVLVVVALLAGGCKERDPAYGACRTILDCKTGESCVGRLCQAGAPSPAGPFAVELVPTSNAPNAPVHNEITGLPIAGPDLELRFGQPVEVSGRVIVAGGEQSEAASVTLSRRSHIGLADEIYSTTAAPGRVAPDAGFKLRVPPTTTEDDADCTPESDCYELRVVPTNLQALPPLTKLVALPASKAPYVGYDLTLAGGGDALALMGCVRDAALRGVPNLSVRVVDAAGRMISSEGTTTEDPPGEDPPISANGRFVLTVPVTCGTRPVDGCLKPGVYWLEIAETAAAPHVPRFVAQLPPISDGVVTSAWTAPDIVLPPFLDKALVTVSYRVVGPAQNGQQEPLRGALVQLSTLLTGVPAYNPGAPCAADLCGTFTRQGTTDENGEVSFVLLGPETAETPGGPQQPREYDVHVAPGPSSPYSAFAGTSDVDAAGFGPDLVLSRKLQIAGTLVDDAGTPIGGATVTAVARPVAVAPITGRLTVQLLDEPPSTMQSDAGGNFLLMLEAGTTYDITVVPATGAPYPVWVLPYQRFTGPAPLKVQLPPAALVTGAVTDWQGIPVAGALVRFYEQASSGDPDSGEPVLYLRGEAVSADDGTVKLLLPATLTAPAQ